jgi:hypothetical protein
MANKTEKTAVASFPEADTRVLYGVASVPAPDGDDTETVAAVNKPRTTAGKPDTEQGIATVTGYNVPAFVFVSGLSVKESDVREMKKISRENVFFSREIFFPSRENFFSSRENISFSRENYFSSREDVLNSQEIFFPSREDFQHLQP